MKEVKNIRDLINEEDLVQYIVEDITDIPEDTEVSYEVWTLGYDANGVPTDSEMLISEFTDPDAAVECAKQLTLADIVHQAAEECEVINEHFEDVSYISIEVETVIEDEDDGTMNIGTIYKRDLWVDGEYGFEDCLETCLDEIGNPFNIVDIVEHDYELLGDGTLKVSRSFLRDFNKNDYVTFRFIDENEPSILTFKIISTVVYEDGDYFHCEFMY